MISANDNEYRAGGTVLKNGLVFTKNKMFLPLDVTVSGGTITAVGTPGASEAEDVIDCSGCYVLPGLTDVHLHGCAGHDLCNGGDALTHIAGFEYSRGVTTFCPATMTLPEEQLGYVLRSAAECAKAQSPGTAEAVGIHLEGPFISRAKCGAQKAEHIMPPSAEKLRRWQSAAEGLIRLVTIAPETEGATKLIRECADKFHFSLGHTECSYDTALEAFAAGADHVTHLYNAMPPFRHREPGLIGAAFDTPECFVELICDGVHSTPAAVRMAFRLFGERLLLISDSMEATGMHDGEYALGGQQVTKRGNIAQLADGTIAGSVSDLYSCLLTAVSMGVPLEDAVTAATLTPCRSVGIDKRYGSIEVGKAGRFLILDSADLSIRRVI